MKINIDCIVLYGTSWRDQRCPWKKNEKKYLEKYFEPITPPATHECPQKISAQSV